MPAQKVSDLVPLQFGTEFRDQRRDRGLRITMTEDLREATQLVCDKLIELCKIEVAAGRNVSRLGKRPSSEYSKALV
jgi:hypothetical protein